MTGGHLLPSNATPWMKAVSLTSGERRPLDVDVIRRTWDPAKCPADLLPFLAHAFSCDVWNPAWPEHQKRRVIADAIKLHRLKGTLAGLEAYAELAGSEVVRAVVPPGTFFLSGGLGDAELARLREKMPQIRIYRQTLRSKARRRLFLSARSFSCLAGPRFVADSRADDRKRPRIVFAENGVESPIRVEEVVDVLPGVGRAFYERALLRRPRRKGVTYLGEVPRFLVSLDPTRSVASFRRSPGASGLIRYGLKPASVDPEPNFIPAKVGRAFMFGQIPRGRFLGGLEPDQRVFERIVIWDPDLVPRRRGASHFGVSRFGVAPFTAELAVHIPGKRSRSAFALGPRGFIGGHFVTPDGEAYRETFRALRAAKAVRDRILINTKTFRSPLAGTLIVAGTPFIAGRLLRS